LEQERRGQPGDAPVAVAEGVDAQEIEHEGGDHQKRRHALFVAYVAVVQAECRDGLVVALLPCPCVSGEAALGEGMKSLDDRRCDRDPALPREDPVQRLTVQR